jgi:ABC-2 type transport system permease protein
MNFLVMPMFFFSGALFPVRNLKGILNGILRLDPLTYGVDGLRGALSHGFAFGIVPDFVLLGLATSVLLALGNYFFSKIEV